MLIIASECTQRYVRVPRRLFPISIRLLQEPVSPYANVFRSGNLSTIGGHLLHTCFPRCCLPSRPLFLACRRGVHHCKFSSLQSWHYALFDRKPSLQDSACADGELMHACAAVHKLHRLHTCLKQACGSRACGRTQSLAASMSTCSTPSPQ